MNEKVKCKLSQTCMQQTKKLLKLVKTPLKTDATNWLLLSVILTSKKEKMSFF